MGGRAYTSFRRGLLRTMSKVVMAIYHLSVKVISRANGSSALASAAYRSASRLHDQRLDRDHDFSNKSGVVHSLEEAGGPKRSVPAGSGGPGSAMRL